MVTGVESHEALRIRLRDERKTRKYHFKKMSKSIPENPLSMCPGKTINVVGVRYGILRFAVAMEEEMKKKDKKYNDEDRTNFDFLMNHLKEEREEVDHELILDATLHDKSLRNNKYDTKVELVHEAIMCMLIRDII